MLVIAGAQASTRFARRCSDGEGVEAIAYGLSKLEVRRHHYIDSKDKVGKGLFIQGRSVYLFHSFRIILGEPVS